MSRRVLIVAALAVVSAAFLAVEIRDGWGDLSGEQFPAPGWFVLAVVLLAAGQVVIGEAMAALPAPPTTAADRRRTFHLTQPAKYVPAGVAQAAGVVVVLVGRGASRSASAVVWIIHTGSLVVAGVAVGLVTAPALGWSPLLVVPGVAVTLAVSRPVLRPIFARVGRWGGVDALEAPPSVALGGCLGAAIVGVALHGLGFAALVRGADLDVGTVEALAAYTLAFGVSVATPLPGGLGAREAIILAVLGAAESVLLVPVVLVRLVLIGIEVVLFGLARFGPGARVSAGRDVRGGDGAAVPPADPH
ncbi:MAG: hypothetical protein AAGA90_17385 [Actinomycetota bacterium]